jgi:hypothetical protein
MTDAETREVHLVLDKMWHKLAALHTTYTAELDALSTPEILRLRGLLDDVQEKALTRKDDFWCTQEVLRRLATLDTDGNARTLRHGADGNFEILDMKGRLVAVLRPKDVYPVLETLKPDASNFNEVMKPYLVTA